MGSLLVLAPQSRLIPTAGSLLRLMVWLAQKPHVARVTWRLPCTAFTPTRAPPIYHCSQCGYPVEAAAAPWCLLREQEEVSSLAGAVGRKLWSQQGLDFASLLPRPRLHHSQVALERTSRSPRDKALTKYFWLGMSGILRISIAADPSTARRLTSSVAAHCASLFLSPTVSPGPVLSFSLYHLAFRYQ